MPQGQQCQFCKHLFSLWKCRAFPEGIPTVIWTGKFDHSKQFSDENFLFEQVADTFQDAEIVRAQARLDRFE